MNHQMEIIQSGESPVVVRFYPLENITAMFYAANIERTMLHSPTKYYKLFPFIRAFNSRLPILLAPSKSSLNLIKSLLNPMKSLRNPTIPPPFFCLPIFSNTALTTSRVPIHQWEMLNPTRMVDFQERRGVSPITVSHHSFWDPVYPHDSWLKFYPMKYHHCIPFYITTKWLVEPPSISSFPLNCVD